MVAVGIDALAIDTPRYYFQLADLAQARGIDPEKFITGLGQHAMSILPPGEDIITMGANAAKRALFDIDRDQIEWVLFATESGLDFSKAAGIYLHSLLRLPARCRVVELKQACYSATAAIQLALPFLKQHPDKKVLLVASDVARYALNSSGESSQGAGAVAMVLSASPRILAFEEQYGVVTEHIMDFWRPNYLNEALVEGKYSSKMYLSMLEATWEQYQNISNRQFADHAHFVYHAPVPRLVEKAHALLLKREAISASASAAVSPSLRYARVMGNCYAASLYICLASLFDHVNDDLTGKRIGLYSYGSGCVAEYFSAIVQEGYQHHLQTAVHADLLSSRTSLDYETYLQFYHHAYPQDDGDYDVPSYHVGSYRLARIQQHKRIYTESAVSMNMLTNQTKELVGQGV